jgi:hypothetical protein
MNENGMDKNDMLFKVKEANDFMHRLTQEIVKFQKNIDNGTVLPALQVRTLHLHPETLPVDSSSENVGKLDSVLLMQPSMCATGQTIMIDRNSVRPLIDVLESIEKEYLMFC